MLYTRKGVYISMLLPVVLIYSVQAAATQSFSAGAAWRTPVMTKGNDRDVHVLQTQDFTINIHSHCGFGVYDCNKVSYRGQSIKDNAVVRLTGESYRDERGSLIYEFRNGNMVYKVSKSVNGLIILDDNKVLFAQNGIWLP